MPTESDKSRALLEQLEEVENASPALQDRCQVRIELPVTNAAVCGMGVEPWNATSLSVRLQGMELHSICELATSEDWDDDGTPTLAFRKKAFNWLALGRIARYALKKHRQALAKEL